MHSYEKRRLDQTSFRSYLSNSRYSFATFYQLVKEKVRSYGKELGDMAHCYVHLMTMIGKMIGFSITDGNQVLCSSFDTPLIETTFKLKRPSLSW